MDHVDTIKGLSDVLTILHEIRAILGNSVSQLELLGQ